MNQSPGRKRNALRRLVTTKQWEALMKKLSSQDGALYIREENLRLGVLDGTEKALLKLALEQQAPYCVLKQMLRLDLHTSWASEGHQSLKVGFDLLSGTDVYETHEYALPIAMENGASNETLELIEEDMSDHALIQMAVMMELWEVVLRRASSPQYAPKRGFWPALYQRAEKAGANPQILKQMEDSMPFEDLVELGNWDKTFARLRSEQFESETFATVYWNRVDPIFAAIENGVPEDIVAHLLAAFNRFKYAEDDGFHQCQEKANYGVESKKELCDMLELKWLAAAMGYGISHRTVSHVLCRGATRSLLDGAREAEWKYHAEEKEAVLQRLEAHIDLLETFNLERKQWERKAQESGVLYSWGFYEENWLNPDKLIEENEKTQRQPTDKGTPEYGALVRGRSPASCPIGVPLTANSQLGLP